MPREEEEVQALDESFNTRLERALAQEADGNLTLQPTRSLQRSPLGVKQTQEQARVPVDGYLSDDDKFQQLLDRKLLEEQEKLEREGIPAHNGIPLVPIKPVAPPESSAPRSSKEKFSRKKASVDKENRPIEGQSNPSVSALAAASSVALTKVTASSITTSKATASSAAAASVTPAASTYLNSESAPTVTSAAAVSQEVPTANESVLHELPASTRRGTYVLDSQPKSDVSDAIGNVSVVAELPSTSRASASRARATSSSSEDANAKSVDVNDKKLKTPRKAGVKKLAAGTPAPSAKTDAQTLLGRIVAPSTIASSLEQDPKLLQENNRRLAQELSRARMDMRDMHNHHEKERQDLQDEIVRLRQLAGGKDDGVREMLEKRVERALTCHNGALEKVATLLGDDAPTRLHCRITFILENVAKLKAVVDDLKCFCFGEAAPGGKFLELLQLVSCIHDNAQEHDEMVRSFVEKLGDAQLNLQLALEDDVDFLSSSAMPTIMNPLNASTLHHDKTRLQQILTDKTESLQRNQLLSEEHEEDDADVGAQGQLPHELSNVIEEDENKRGSSYLLARKRSSAVTRRTSVVPQPQNADNEETVRRSRNSRRESMRLSSGFPQAIFKSPRVSQLQSGDGGTPSNRTLSIDSGSPTSVDGSPNVLDRPVLSPGLSLTDATTPSNHVDEPIALDLNASSQNLTSTESNDMELTTSEPSPPAYVPTDNADNDDEDDESLTATLDKDGQMGGAVATPVSHSFSNSFGMKNASHDSLITPEDQRRVSSFVRLDPTPPDGPAPSRASLPLASPLLQTGKLSLPPSSDNVVDLDDGEPSTKKSKTTIDVDPPAASASLAPAVGGRGSRKSKMTAAQNLKDTSFDDSGVFVPPAPPKAAKAVTGKNKQKATQAKKADGPRTSSSSSTTSSPSASKGRASSKGAQNAKIGDVDMDTYKKMIVGQKAKPVRSKSRKLSKSEEKEIRAAADMRAKTKPLEYAAFDASSRFGEGLSFLDDTHVPTLTEFKQKQLNKPSSDALPTVATASVPPVVVIPPLAAVVPSKRVVPSPGVAEDFLTASSAAAAAASSSDAMASPNSDGGAATGGRKGSRKGRRGSGRKKIDYRDSVGGGDDDDFVTTKPKKKPVKPRAPAKKENQTNTDDDNVFLSPRAPTPDCERETSASSIGNRDGQTPEKINKKKKKQLSLMSCGDDEESKERVSDAQPGRRRGRGQPKSYAEPALNTKMRR